MNNDKLLSADLFHRLDMLNAVKDMIFVIKADGDTFCYIWMNQAACYEIGVDETIYGRQIEDVLSPEQVAVVKPKYQQAAAEKSTIVYEDTFVTSRGSFVRETILIPICFENETCGIIVAVVRDVTERKKKEQERQKANWELEINEQKFRALMEHNTDIIFELDLHGTVRRVNHVVETILGYSADEMIGRLFIIFVAREDRKRALRHLQKAIEGDSEEYEVSVYHRAGKKVNLQIKNVPVIVHNQVAGVFCIAKNIMEKKQRLASCGEHYRKLVEFLPEAIIVFNTEGKIMYINLAGVKLLGGKQKKDIIGNAIWKFFRNAAQIAPKKRKQWQNSSDVQEIFVEEFVRLDGKPIYLEVSLSSVEYAGESAMQGIFRDVTERINYEKQLEFLAFHDPLTKLPNRRLFFDIVDKSIIEAERTKSGLAVLYLDMDNFKDVNDTFGHDIGDELLKQFAKRIKKNVGEHNVVCRIGGDEFLVLLKGVKERTDVHQIAKRLSTNIRKPYRIKHLTIRTTASMGIAVYPIDGTTSKALIHHADQALYQAKMKKNCYRFYSF
ncbi:diguanylate cyclase domain-containing protein [Parageobacillus thermoglucosidasius]|uniref:diguanylate cyclase domain-containing protein n=1 Tax=Parageobacillus thermoglucosidasius TaxID=1426 RepID=UPI000B562D9A|nr:diguanylate cyclase [Parageobacillus thermoglucosidasius]MBY6268656.1 diguanylate cyclase [Parageobacillus thermoglucosidasius]OUM94510.1 MAG: diguanylate cyclase [Parageobacillus thermoglucosidasius]